MAFGHEKLDVYRAAIEKLGQQGYAVHEETEAYRTNQIDTDTDPDTERQS